MSQCCWWHPAALILANWLQIHFRWILQSLTFNYLLSISSTWKIDKSPLWLNYHANIIDCKSKAFDWHSFDVATFFRHQTHHIFTCKHAFVTTISVFMENRTICYQMYKHQTFHLMKWHVTTAQLHIIPHTERNHQQRAILPSNLRRLTSATMNTKIPYFGDFTAKIFENWIYKADHTALTRNKCVR